MAVLLSKGRFRARLAQSDEDLAAAQALRTRAFGTGALDADAFDPVCAHVLVEDLQDEAALVCCFRMLTMDSGTEVGRSYSAQFYDLSRLVAQHVLQRIDARVDGRPIFAEIVYVRRIVLNEVAWRKHDRIEGHVFKTGDI